MTSILLNELKAFCASHHLTLGAYLPHHSFLLVLPSPPPSSPLDLLADAPGYLASTPFKPQFKFSGTLLRDTFGDRTEALFSPRQGFGDKDEKPIRDDEKGGSIHLSSSLNLTITTACTSPPFSNATTLVRSLRALHSGMAGVAASSIPTPSSSTEKTQRGGSAGVKKNVQAAVEALPHQRWALKFPALFPLDSPVLSCRLHRDGEEEGGCTGLVRTVLAWLADQECVHWMEYSPSFTLQNKYNKDVLQTDTLNNTLLWDRGLRGQGQIVAIADTGIDHDMCFFYDPDHELEFGQV